MIGIRRHEICREPFTDVILVMILLLFIYEKINKTSCKDRFNNKLDTDNYGMIII